MRSGALILAAALLCSGCGKEWRPLDARALEERRPRTISVAVAKRPVFLARTHGRRWLWLFFGLGGLIFTNATAEMEGKYIVKRNAIGDPGRKVGSRLVEALAREHALEVGRSWVIGGPKLPDRPLDADLVLFVRTLHWGFAPASEGYRIDYAARIELHDRREKRILAAGECESPPRAGYGRPGYEQLLADRAALLKRTLDRVAEVCLRRFAAGLLGSRGEISIEEDEDGDEDEDEDEDEDGGKKGG